MPAALSSSTKARANAGSPFRSYGVPGIKSGASSATQTPRWGSCTVAYQLNVETQCAELTTNRSGRRPRSARPICFRPSIRPVWKAGTRSSMPSRGACGATATAMRPPGMFSSSPASTLRVRARSVSEGSWLFRRSRFGLGHELPFPTFFPVGSLRPGGDPAGGIPGDQVPGQFLKLPVHLLIPLGLFVVLQDAGHGQADGAAVVKHGKVKIGVQRDHGRRGVSDGVLEHFRLVGHAGHFLLVDQRPQGVVGLRRRNQEDDGLALAEFFIKPLDLFLRILDVDRIDLGQLLVGAHGSKTPLVFEPLMCGAPVCNSTQGTYRVT